MTHSKNILFSEDLQLAANYFKALSHPARLSILQFLAEKQVCISGDISNELPLSRTTVSQHLNELKEAGLIKGEIEGVRTNYCLNIEKIKEMENTIHEFTRNISTHYENSQRC